MTRSKLEKSMDRLWSIRVREKAGYRCEYCGATPPTVRLNAHHIFTRRAKSVRWDVDNGICLCAKHHVYSSEFSAHLTPCLFHEFVVNLRGEEWYDKLKLKHRTIKKYTMDDLRTIKEGLK